MHVLQFYETLVWFVLVMSVVGTRPLSLLLVMPMEVLYRHSNSLSDTSISVSVLNLGPTEVLSESNSIFSGVRYHSLVPESFNNGYDHITPKDNQFCYEVPQEDEPTYAEVPDDTVEPESDIVSDAADPHYKSPKGSHDRSNDQVADDVSHDYDYVADDEQDQPADRRRSQYACVDKGRKKVRDPAASYSLVDKSSKVRALPIGICTFGD